MTEESFIISARCERCPEDYFLCNIQELYFFAESLNTGLKKKFLLKFLFKKGVIVTQAVAVAITVPT